MEHDGNVNVKLESDVPSVGVKLEPGERVAAKSEPACVTQVPSKKDTGIYTTDLTAEPPTCQKFVNGRVDETSPILKGPNGFLMAQFACGERELDLPNLMLDTILKNQAKPSAPLPKKAMKAMKAKAAKPKKAMKAMKAVAEEAPEEKSYEVLYYKNSNCVGLRRKYGAKNQVFSFGGVNATKTKAQMREIGADIAKRIATGELTYAQAINVGNEKAFAA